MTDDSRRTFSRRTALVTLSGIVGGLAGCSTAGEEGAGDGGDGGSGGGGETETQTATSTSTPTPTATATPSSENEVPSEVTEWLSDVDNYDGTVTDRTGQNEVSVMTGTEGNGDNFAFDPAAIRVETGSTVTWEWTGKGGSHNVVADSGGDFESDLVDEEGFTFGQTFESSGVITYFCSPHKGLGMKGAIIVE